MKKLDPRKGKYNDNGITDKITKKEGSESRTYNRKTNTFLMELCITSPTSNDLIVFLNFVRVLNDM